MKYEILGFNQEEVIKLAAKKEVSKKGVKSYVNVKLDATDLLILSDIADFMNRKSIQKVIINDKIYCWVKYSQIIKDLPILDIKEQAFSDRLDKLVLFGFLEKEVMKNNSGSFTYFRIGDKYEQIKYKTEHEATSSQLPVRTSSQLRVRTRSQLRAKDSNTNNDSLTNNTKKEEKDKSFSKKDDFLPFDIGRQEENDDKKKKKRVATPKDDARFEECWKAYRRKGSKQKAKAYWDKMTEAEKEKVLPHIKAYTQAREECYQSDFQRYLRDKIFNDVVYLGNVAIYDPEKEYNKDEYRPSLDGFNLIWNDSVQCYVCIGYVEDLLDGYADDDRPASARIYKNGVRYRWDVGTKKWVEL